MLVVLCTLLGKKQKSIKSNDSKHTLMSFLKISNFVFYKTGISEWDNSDFQTSTSINKHKIY